MSDVKGKTGAVLRETAVLTGAVAIIAASVFFFLVPSHTSVSSISGLGIVLSNFVPLPLSVITMILNVVLLLIGSALQIGTYAAPMLAAFLIIPVLEEYGPRYALTLYATVSILAVLFVPETELAFFYVLVMGYYPVLRVKLNGVKSTLLRWVLKFAVFNAGTVLVYLLLFALLGPAVLDELLADGVGMLAALLAAGNLSFWLCDRALAALTRYYHVILKPKLKKKF